MRARFAVLAALAATSLAALALPGSPALAAPKAQAAATTLKITVTNGRDIMVTGLSVTEQGAAKPSGALKAPLAPGKSATVSFKAKKGACVYDFAGVLDGGEDFSAEGIDLCKDSKVTIVE